MYSYRFSLHKYAPELSTIQKIRINKTKKTINVIKEKKLDSWTAYKIIVGEINPNNLLNDDFFNSLDVK